MPLKGAIHTSKGTGVIFHENGIEYVWFIARREVCDRNGMVVAKDCYNLQQARRAVQK